MHKEDSSNKPVVRVVLVAAGAAVATVIALVLLQLTHELLSPWLLTGRDLIFGGIEDGHLISPAAGSLLVLGVIAGSMMVSFGVPFWALKKILVARGLA